jgi:NAD(P)H-hydrate epimerase
MRYALTADEIREVEAAAVARGDTTPEALMERAGGALAAEVARRAPEGEIVVVTGKGNNGGDGWVAARALAEVARAVRVLACAPPDTLAGPAAAAAHTAARAGVAWDDAREARVLARALETAAAVVDAVFGVGFAGVAREPYASAIDAIVAAGHAGALVVSADVPSGVDADSGAVTGAAVRAAVTVTFSAFKPGLLLYPGAAHTGEIVVADVGLAGDGPAPTGALEVWDGADYRALLPALPADVHKGSRGRVLVVAGSHRFAGAAVLAAAGAARMGAGYVVAAVPSPVVPVVQSALPHVIVADIEADAEGGFALSAAAAIRSLASEADAVVLGPGIGLGEGARALVAELVDSVEAPVVLDADALNALATAWPRALAARDGRGAATIATPHPGEAARLLGMTTGEVQADRPAAARRLAGARRACVLKGARTVVAGAGRAAVTLAGNPGMATAGTGDVLAGMLGTLAAQGLEPYEAGLLAAYLHGRAGDLAADALTERCLVSGDLTEYLPAAVRELLDPPLG